MGRVIFESKAIRDNFFKVILEKSTNKTWASIYKKYSLSRIMLDRYRTGQLSLPLQLYRRLVYNFSQEEKNIFLKEINLLEDNWGMVKGGLESYKKNKKSFDEGRKLGLQKIIKLNLKNTFDGNEIILDEAWAKPSALLPLKEGWARRR